MKQKSNGGRTRTTIIFRGKTCILAKSSASVSADIALDYPDLKTVINAWPGLSDDDKRAILEIVNSGCEAV